MVRRSRPGLGAVRTWLAFGAVAVATVTIAPVTVALSTAFACTNLATVSPGSDVVRPGDRITLVGTSFPVPRTTGLTATPVAVRWRSVDGPVLAETVPDRTGTISVTIQVPDAPPGHVIIVITQRRPLPGVDGAAGQAVQYVDEPGTPARTSIRVLAPGEPFPTPRLASNRVASTDSGAGTTLLVLTVVLGAVALSLFGGGFIAYLHQARARAIEAESQPWPPWSPPW